MEGKYLVQAQEGQTAYEVTITATQCLKEPNCVPQCTSKECDFLCRHQISCTCWDYQEGHLCKHCHKVRSISRSTDYNADPRPQSFSFTPNRTLQTEQVCFIALSDDSCKTSTYHDYRCSAGKKTHCSPFTNWQSCICNRSCS